MARMRPRGDRVCPPRSAIMANVASFCDGPADKPVRQRWVDQFSPPCTKATTAPTSASSPTTTCSVRQAYPGSTWDRLVQIKARYDPTNLFHHNHNIPTAIRQRPTSRPAGTATAVHQPACRDPPLSPPRTLPP